MTGSAFLPIGSYMLDMPIEGSYRYCRISLGRSPAPLPRYWGHLVVWRQHVNMPIGADIGVR